MPGRTSSGWRNWLRFFAFVLLGGLLGLAGLPWWWLPVIALAGSLIFPLPAGQAFVSGFLAGFLLWWAVAFWQNLGNNGMLAIRIGQLFQGLSGFALLLVTGTLGGLLAAFGALTGRYAATLKTPPKPRPKRGVMLK